MNTVYGKMQFFCKSIQVACTVTTEIQGNNYNVKKRDSFSTKGLLVSGIKHLCSVSLWTIQLRTMGKTGVHYVLDLARYSTRECAT